MNKSVETLIDMLSAERTERVIAVNRAEASARSLSICEVQLKDAEEASNFQYERAQRLMEDNDILRRQIASQPTNADLNFRLNNALEAAKSLAHRFVVVPLFDEDPEFYTRNKIPFIKEIRERSGLGLKESKDLADVFLESNAIFTASLASIKEDGAK